MFLKFFKLSISSLILISQISCINDNKSPNVSRVIVPNNGQGYRQTNDYRSNNIAPRETNNQTNNSFTGCKNNSDSSKEISINKRQLKFIDSHNIDNYLLSGRCKNSNLLVYVTVNNYETNKNPACKRGSWKISLDLTSVITPDDEELTFHIKHNRETICKKAKITFRGPQGYISIPGTNQYSSNSNRRIHAKKSFFVMKYEAKLDRTRANNPKAVSKPEDKPIAHMSYFEAVELCNNNGSRYDLMKNSQWQNIATSIEETHENWSQGRSIPSDSNLLNCGIIRGPAKAASKNDDNDCANTSCNSPWDMHKRTHLLQSGNRIWDICGSVGEIVKDKYTSNTTFNDYAHKLNLSANKDLDRLFGPKKSYSSSNTNTSRRNGNWNLGFVSINKTNDLIIRGLSARGAGIFSVQVNRNQDSLRGYSANVGFRCIYAP